MASPGPPQNVRPSSYRGSNFLKMRWNAPAYNAEFVVGYKAKYKKARDEADIWHVFKVTRKDKLSAMAHNLEPNTDYFFCVQALNQNDEGESAEIEMNT